ncbi:Ribonuclease H-like domain [Lasallia pustulata]|uniref:Ribonuclease H-like domain n=1 Tax=Lasallia pustulata TaxID=136370 RepID=A0A1W5CVU4_9LECA|nr:Ribonuclease H-like domain [Lasallia pustulata]
MSSNWAARTKFPPKKKGSDQLRVVHNFIPVNKCTIKSEYPMHRLEEVLDILIKLRFSCYFSTDASNSYWAVPIKAGDEYKAGIITPHGQYAYRRMGQGLKGAPHTYSQFTDLVFGPIPQNDVSGEPRMDTIIGDHGNTAMALFMDDYAASATDFDSLYNFLADFFFPRAAFGPIYLNPKKTVVFGINLDLLGFTGGAGTIRPSIKHRDKNRPEIEACDEDLTKPARGERYRPYQTIRTKWIERTAPHNFIWAEEQQASFDHIKQNPMIGIADGLSRLPKGLATDFIPDDAPHMTTPILPDNWTKQSEEKKLAPAYDGQGWEKFNQSPELMRIVYYLRFGKEGLGDMPRSELRALQHRATKFSLGERTGILLYTERNGARAPCIVGEEIPAILGHLHDGHGHYSHIITLDRLIGEAYWPTRAHDVITWCRLCQACQVRGPKQGKEAMKHILELEPMSMVGLDFLGPINPSCNATNHKYILLAIDYFTRFMWMESYSFCTMIEVADLFQNQIVPVFGWPEAIYSDNGSHFTGQEINTIFQSHGVTHYTAPVTHPSSVGLIERNVQLVLSQLRARCIAAGTPGSWSRYIPEIALSINTRLIQVHGYSPAELLLGYKPKLAHFNIQPLKLPIWTDEMEAEATRTHGLYVALREETRNQATESLATHQGKNEAKRAIPLGLLSPGDLVLVRDTQLDNQRGRKLEARWRGPRMLVQMTKEHLSGWVKPIYENGKMKRYHRQDMKKYVSRVKPGQEGVQTYEPIESNQDDAKLLDDNSNTKEQQ